MASSFEDAVRLAVCIGADADTLGAIVGSIAEAIWGIPWEIRDGIEKYLTEEMKSVLDAFHHERPRSFKPLMDTTFDETAYSDASADLLPDDERNELLSIVDKQKAEKRNLMAERAKARYHW